MIFYTNRPVPSGAAACARGPFIFIRPKYRGDVGLLEHERVHVKQCYRTLGIHAFLYLLSKRYRLNAEVEAYRAQARYYADDRRPLFARFICDKYGLSVSYAEVLAALRAPA